MARVASCVVAGNGQLTGFLYMPVDPFVWVRLRRVAHLSVERSPGWEPETMDRLVSGPKLVLPERMNEPLVAVSDELVQLFDTYGVAFPFELSEVFSYEPAELYDVVRSVRFLRGALLHEVTVAFARLVDSWLAVNAAVGSVVCPHLGEVALMRTLFSAFTDVPTRGISNPSGWDLGREKLVGHLLTPQVDREQLTVAQWRRREKLVAEAGYHHVW